MRPKFQRFAMFNCQRLNDIVKQTRITDDFYKLHLAAIMVQETCIKETGLNKFISSDGKKVCLCNSGNGSKWIWTVGIITTENKNVTFKPVSERIFIITTNTNENIKRHLISTYAATLENTVRNPDETHIFYEKLSSLINSIKQRDALTIGGDFNAKTKLQVSEMENQLVVGKYSKSNVKENGNLLIEFCKLYNLLITSTIFKHKPSRQTTWISTLPPTFPRKNPYRNQIDYILLRQNITSKIFDSRSFNSNFTRSGHKPVIAKIQNQMDVPEKSNRYQIF